MARKVGARSIASIKRSSTVPGRKCLGKREFRWPADDERDVQPLLVTKLLPAHVALAVVGREHNDRAAG